VKSISVEGHASPHPYLELHAAPESVTLLLGIATGQVSGTVDSEKGPLATQVYLTPAREFGWIFERNKTAGADGKYSFEGVPPGKYTVSIRREVHMGNAVMSERVPSDSGDTAVIEVPDGGQVTRDLKIKN